MEFSLFLCPTLTYNRCNERFKWLIAAKKSHKLNSKTKKC